MSDNVSVLVKLEVIYPLDGQYLSLGFAVGLLERSCTSWRDILCLLTRSSSFIVSSYLSVSTVRIALHKLADSFSVNLTVEVSSYIYCEFQEKLIAIVSIASSHVVRLMIWVFVSPLRISLNNSLTPDLDNY